jgi:TonB family protein
LQIKEYYTYSYPEWPGTPEGLLPQAQQLCFQICFLQHVQKHFQIPEMVRQMGIHGTTTAEVTINEKGLFDRIEIVESIDPVVDQEVIRVLKQAPQLTPKTVEGVPAKSVVKLPVVFQLN